jgi:hypothetical protein
MQLDEGTIAGPSGVQRTSSAAGPSAAPKPALPSTSRRSPLTPIPATPPLSPAAPLQPPAPRASPPPLPPFASTGAPRKSFQTPLFLHTHGNATLFQRCPRIFLISCWVAKSTHLSG